MASSTNEYVDIIGSKYTISGYGSGTRVERQSMVDGFLGKLRDGEHMLDNGDKVKHESDPNGRSANEPGSKLDAGKAPLLRGCLQYFPRALEEVSRVSLVGANKYTWKGWESVPDGINRYGDALVRHIVAEEVQGDYDNDTGLLHASQVAWNALARLELILKCRT